MARKKVTEEKPKDEPVKPESGLEQSGTNDGTLVQGEVKQTKKPSKSFGVLKGKDAEAVRKAEKSSK
jgi:hypothetical protein